MLTQHAKVDHFYQILTFSCSSNQPDVIYQHHLNSSDWSGLLVSGAPNQFTPSKTSKLFFFQQESFLKSFSAGDIMDRSALGPGACSWCGHVT